MKNNQNDDINLDDVDDVDAPDGLYGKMDMLQYVVHLNRMLLKKLRLAMQRAPFITGKKADLAEDIKLSEIWNGQYDRMFGKNHSLADALSEVADIALKLDRHRPGIEAPEPESYAVSMDEKDVDIVQHFLARSSKEF